MNLVYIDDVVDELISALTGNEHREGAYCKVSAVYTVTLGAIVELLYSFRENRNNLGVPHVGDALLRNFTPPISLICRKMDLAILEDECGCPWQFHGDYSQYGPGTVLG